jgi:predicted ATP-grasp superfamily ATP-dependent carboligase
MAVLAVAALSARVMAQAAVKDGFDVIALDLFGDKDTRLASLQWLPIGEPAEMRIDPALVLQALHQLARRGDVIGWVVGGGFDGLADLLEQGGAVLPLLGAAPQCVRRVRDAADFFGFLDAEGIAHPEVQWVRPQNTDGWIEKDALGSGGWHIRRATGQGSAAAPPHHYFQREMAGTPMSATFVANGSDVALLGFNEVIVRRIGGRPFVYCGVVGPVPLAESVAASVKAALGALVAEFSLCGLGSLDFMLDGDVWGVLEINPRPPASFFIYGAAIDRGVMGAHLNACLRGELPRPAVDPPPPVSGSEIVFARQHLVLSDAAAGKLATRADAQDLPAAGVAFEAGDPVCSVLASGEDAGQVKRLLDAACSEILQDLETSS